MNVFSNRRLAIATMHGKEQVISPLLSSYLGVVPFLTNGLDTDQLGTFSGEIDRKNDAMTTVREKCRLAYELTGCDLVVASEGSFGPHPSIPFLAADDEIVMLCDFSNDLEIVGRKLSLSTNFKSEKVTSWQQVQSFIEMANFPTHGVILMPSQSNDIIHKGIIDPLILELVFDRLSAHYGELIIKTDMRAHFNPTRMRVIEEATRKLTDVALSLCPRCVAPGFVMTDILPGLPCALCGSPTRTPRAYILSCAKCLYNEERAESVKAFEDPRNCDFCNP